MASSTEKAVVTIGVPVFNGSPHIERALQSIQSQTFTNYRVIISDNASTDGTGRICEAIAESDDRVRYVRQAVNIGAARNFEFLVGLADARFFVYLAADDYWEPEFLERNVARLMCEENAVGCISKVDLRRNDDFVAYANGTYEIKGTPTERLYQYFSVCSDNSRFYAVYRSDIIRESFRKAPSYHASDWCVSALTLLHGDHLCVDDLLMHREIAEPNKYLKCITVDNARHRLAKYLPVLPMTVDLFHRLPLAVFLKIIGPIVRLNLLKHVEYVSFKHGGSIYARILERL